MEFVSSDTNVWIDFQVIARLQLPFLLPYTYIMYTEVNTSCKMQSQVKMINGTYKMVEKLLKEELA